MVLPLNADDWEPNPTRGMIDKIAELQATMDNMAIERAGRAFMERNGITDPSGVTAYYQQVPGHGVRFSHFKHEPFNDYGAHI